MSDADGASPISPSYDSAAQAHGTMMFMSFGVFFTVSTIGARYMRRMPKNGPNNLWFWVHTLSNALGLLFFVAGFTIAIFISGVDQFNSAHKQIGLTIACLLILQPVGGVLISYLHSRNPGMSRDKIWLDWPHWILGWAVWLLGLANIPVGLYVATGILGDYVTSKTVHILYFVWMGFVLALVIGLEILYRVRGGNKTWARPGASSVLNGDSKLQ